MIIGVGNVRSKKLRRKLLVLSSGLSGFLFTILIVMLIFDFNHSNFKLKKLVKHIKKDENYLSVSRYYNLDVKTTDDTITINISNDETNDTLVGTLDNNILTYTIPKKDKNILLKGKLLYSVADAIGQVNGNDKGYISSILGSLDYTKMNIKRNGIEIYSDKENNIYKFKVNKKFELGSVADVYFNTDDFVVFKDKLVSDGYAQSAKGNLIFYKIEDNGKKIIYFGEPEELTSRTYNSLLSLIEVMYDKDTADLFGKAFKSIKTGQFNNFNMIANYEATEDEVIYNKLLDNYKILKLEISN